MVTPYQFQCDYIAGCTPQIMDALLHHNLTEVPGYCEDMFCKEAEAKIREACGTKRPHCRTRNGSHRSYRPQGA